MGNSRFVSKIALAASFFALAVIALGAFTRLIDAGLGCPDWPGCYGYLTIPHSGLADHIAANFPHNPFNHYKAAAEMMHRYFAGTLSLLILTLIIAAFIKARTRSNLILSAMLVLLVVYQIILGLWTVTLKLMPIVVTQHLLGGFLILITLWLFYLNNQPAYSKLSVTFNKKWVLPAAYIGLFILLGQIFLGAWTSTNYAALSCPDFPFCFNDKPFTAIQFHDAFNIFLNVNLNYEGGIFTQAVRQSIQMLHRLGALILVSYMFCFSLFLAKKLSRNPWLIKSLLLVWMLIFVQVCIGMINVLYKLPLVTALLHNIIAVLLLLTMVTLIFKLSKASLVKAS